MTTCSIVIANYNYARFVGDAIDSALAQTWTDIEVIVVDDGSTDQSRDVIGAYGDKVVALYRKNNGQGAALNTGYARSQGDIVIFLDADDVLFPHAVATSIRPFLDSRVIKTHWPLRLIDTDGCPLDGLVPNGPLPSGDVAEAVLQGGPTSSLSPPTSGNAFHRRFLQRVMPMPVDVYRLCADEYLYTLAPVFGRLSVVDHPLGAYRLHGANNYSSLTARQKLATEVDTHGRQCEVMAAALRRNGIAVDLEQWRQNSWFHRLQRAVDEIEALVPAGATVVVADDDTWGAGALFHDRHVVAANSLTERGGPPADDVEATALLPALSRFDHLVFGWPAFWWLDAYPRLIAALAERFETTVASDVTRVLTRRNAS